MAMSTPQFEISTPSDRKPPVTEAEKRKRALLLLSIITGVFFAAGGITLLAAYSQRPIFQQHLPLFMGLLGASAVVVVVSEIAASETVTKNISARALLLDLVVNLTLVAFAIFVKGAAVPAGLIMLLYSIIVAFAALIKTQIDWAISGTAVMALAAVLTGILAPFRQLEASGIRTAILIVLGILVLIYVFLVARGVIGATLRVKLVSVVLAIVIIPSTILTTVQAGYSRSALQDQNAAALKLAADQTATTIENFIADTLYNTTINATLPIFSNYIETPESERAASGVEAALNATIESIEKSQRLAYLESIGILDAAGKNIYDSDPKLEGQDESGEKYFDITSKTGTPYLSSIHLPNEEEAYFVFSGPIRDKNQELIGVLRLRYNASIFQRLAADNIGLFGEESYPIIVDDQFIRIADTVNPRFVYQPVAQLSNQAIQQLQSVKRLNPSFQANPETYIPAIIKTIQNIEGDRTFTTDIKGMDPRYPETGVVVKMSKAPWYLIYVQGQGPLFEILDRQNRIAMIVSALVAGIASLLATVLSRVLSNPVIKLTETAEKIASGNLEIAAPVETNDELGTLASAFNMMTRQLRSFINELEDRVQARTQDLARQNEFLVLRARQLQTISDVARDVASAQKIEVLLPRVANLISERFGFYHVGIFLKDDTGEYAVLRAANSEGGQRMLARQHRLKVGQVGIVGYVTGTGKPRIATDVGEDSVFFKNPDLPLTRSEMALPLKIGDQVIGALDVQSTVSGAFSQEDIELFGILADQIAIAIANNRLLEETNQAFEEISSLHRSYLKQEWKRQSEQQKVSGFRYTTQGAVLKEKELQPEIRTVVETGQAIIQNSNVNPDGSLVPARVTLPILLRGEPIGAIHLEEQGKENRAWAENEILAVQSITDQIALALENARLFEETVRRADRERKTLEITSKLRATNDFQSIIQVAVDELQQVLNASRAQIVLRRSDLPEQEPENNREPYGKNGHESEP